jgi:hypothetical protein
MEVDLPACLVSRVTGSTTQQRPMKADTPRRQHVGYLFLHSAQWTTRPTLLQLTGLLQIDRRLLLVVVALYSLMTSETRHRQRSSMSMVMVSVPRTKRSSQQPGRHTARGLFSVTDGWSGAWREDSLQRMLRKERFHSPCIVRRYFGVPSLESRVAFSSSSSSAESSAPPPSRPCHVSSRLHSRPCCSSAQAAAGYSLSL